MRFITIPAPVSVGSTSLTWAELLKTWTSDQIFGRSVETLLHAVHLRERLGEMAKAGDVVAIDEAAWALLVQAAATPSVAYVPDSGIAVIPIIDLIWCRAASASWRIESSVVITATASTSTVRWSRLPSRVTTSW